MTRAKADTALILKQNYKAKNKKNKKTQQARHKLKVQARDRPVHRRGDAHARVARAHQAAIVMIT